MEDFLFNMSNIYILPIPLSGISGKNACINQNK
jgi:hypothetical protein